MDNAARAHTLVDQLRLDRPPVGLAFVDRAPDAVPPIETAVPAACAFWRVAETTVFYADASRHYDCPVGAMTMGFELPEEHGPATQALLGTMLELEYLGQEELAHLPGVRRPHRGIVYGPLALLPVEPDVVLVIATPNRAMILGEASEAVAMRQAPALPAMGRPACAAVAWATNEGQPTLSLGCIGARTYAEVPDERALVVVPGTALDRVVDRLSSLTRANDTLEQYHRRKKARYEDEAAGGAA